MEDKPIKVFSVRLKTFKYLAYLIVIAGFAYVIDAVSRNTPESLSGAFTYGLIVLIVGGFFFYFGRKERSFKFYEDRVEYWTSNNSFIAKWEDIALIKSFQEMGKTSEDLIIMKENEETLSVSTAFFDKFVLNDVFKELVEVSKVNEHITIEDDRLWLENKD